MAARTGHTTYVPGKGATTVKEKVQPSGKVEVKKTFQGKGPAPAGAVKQPEVTAETAPTVTVSPTGKVSTSGFRKERAAKAAVRQQKRSERRVKQIVRTVKRQRAEAPPKLPKAPTVKPVELPKPPSYKPPKFQGKPTAGTPTLGELRTAKQAGALKVNKAGAVTTPAVRQASRAVKQARRVVAKTTGVTGPLTPSQKKIAKLVSKETGGVLKPRTVATQELQEMSGEHAAQRDAERNFNTLNIGYFDSGPGELTQDPTWSNPRSAAKATAEFFKGQKYGPSEGIKAILPQAKGKSVAEQLEIIGNSGWATSDYAPALAATSELVGEKRNPKAKAQLKQAVKEAQKLGLRPGRSAGDVAPGGARTVKVRADAKGMVKWAESALGTQEGTPKVERWAARFALGDSNTTPWCANFVSNGLIRRGFSDTELPANPNFTGTSSPGYQTWGEEGKYATIVSGGLADAKPGDLLTFGDGGNRHIGVYVGNGEYISGNSSDAVNRNPVDSDLWGVIRPKYKGGWIKVKETAPLPGSTSPTATPSTSTAPASVGLVAAPSTGTAKEGKQGKVQRRRDLTVRQERNQRIKKLRSLGANVRQPGQEPKATKGNPLRTSLAALEAKYGKPAV